MHLKALEIQGFKSFPEKTRLTFEKNITCIVGPNGSGKSNISDAILWVTGEQSAKTLRSGKMEDVIFGGTQKRGQMGFAEVSLILDNTDGTLNIENSEVMITRRYYRSGESEYYINKSAVRLRDVNELLMDTGMGREGYSIIGQGRIDEILSAKSTDRREIFEEAAGISKYRHKKEESERKLMRTEENLVRVGDKIAELELQVEPLRAQAETAKKYLILRDELRGLEISLWMNTLDRLRADAQKLEEGLAAARRDHASAAQELEDFYKRSEDLAEVMRQKDVEADEVRASIAAAEAESADLDSAGAVLKANLESNLAEAERIKTQLEEQAGRDSDMTAQIAEREARLVAVDGEIAALGEKAETLLDELERISRSAGEASERITELMRLENDCITGIGDRRAAISALASAAQEMEDRDGVNALEISAAADRLAELKTERAACEKELSSGRKRESSLKNVINGYTLRAANRQKKYDDACDRRMRLEMDMNALRSRISLLTEMEKEYQGYSKAVRIVMQEHERGSLKGVHGTVGSLVKAEDEYALAIETALGGAVQNIIVDDENVGKTAINMLKRRDGGRATFAPISSMKGNILRENGLDGESGYRGIAYELVSFDARYSGVYANILGRTAVVEELDDAIRIARKYSHRFRIVTLDGQVMNAGGTMTGGSNAKNAGILSRANELEKLTARSADLETELRDAGHECSALQVELEDAKHELEVSESELRAAETQVMKLESDAGHYDLMISAAEESIRSMRTESAALTERLNRTSTEIAAEREALASLEKRLEEIRSDISGASAGQDELSDERQATSDELSSLRAQESALRAENAAVQAAVRELKTLRDGMESGRAQQLGYIDLLNKKSDEIRSELAGRERERADVLHRIDELRQRLSEITDEKLLVEQSRTQQGREMQDINSRLLSLERECASFEQKKLAADMEEKQIVEKLWDTYELSRSDAMQVRMELDNEAEAKRRASELKRAISKLGTPNIGAIDEFERVNSRYTFLTEQRDDIEKAKNELNDIIEDITTEMSAIFAREFENINECFKDVFTELFRGGRASLELEDRDDILNCGIEIKVQPPGKSLKTITLLSGGEKAFVAIALYFAVLKVRPAPFIVMDEIESTLDESNVLRLAEYMRRISDRTQMIVITHRRGTMEEADVLYGVTMQEQGISRIIDIDLEEAEKTIANRGS